MTKKNTFRYSTLLLFFWLAAGTLLASGFDGEVRVWPVHGGDRYCSYEQQDYFIMAARSSYITVLVVDPSGYADIVYPLSAADIIRLRAGRIYRLSELMGGRHLYFDGLNGTAYISVIASRRPVFINDWLLDEYYTYASGYGIGFSLSVELGFYWNARFLRHGYHAASVPVVFGIAGHRHSHERSFRHGYTGSRNHHFRDYGWRTRSSQYRPDHTVRWNKKKHFESNNYKYQKRREGERYRSHRKKGRRDRQQNPIDYYDSPSRKKNMTGKSHRNDKGYKTSGYETRNRARVRHKSTVRQKSVSKREKAPSRRVHKDRAKKQSQRRTRHER